MSKILKTPVIFFSGAATGIALETLFFLTKGSKTRKKESKQKASSLMKSMQKGIKKRKILL